MALVVPFYHSNEKVANTVEGRGILGTAWSQRAEDNLQGLVLSFPQLGSRDGTRVTRHQSSFSCRAISLASVSFISNLQTTGAEKQNGQLLSRTLGQ